VVHRGQGLARRPGQALPAQRPADAADLEPGHAEPNHAEPAQPVDDELEEEEFEEEAIPDPD